MFKTTLAGNQVKLSKATKEGVNKIIANKKLLPDNSDIETLLENENILYWAVFETGSDSLRGIIGITQSLKTNQIYYKFAPGEVGLFKLFEEVLELIIDYLEYIKSRGIYTIEINKPKPGIKRGLLNNGFKYNGSYWYIVI